MIIGVILWLLYVTFTCISFGVCKRGDKIFNHHLAY